MQKHPSRKFKHNTLAKLAGTVHARPCSRSREWLGASVVCDSQRTKVGKGVRNAAETKNATGQYGEISMSSRDYTMM